MFQDEAQEGVHFPSSWKTERSLKDSCAQTSEIITYEADVQTVHSVEAGVQTIVDEEVHQILLDQDDTQSLINFMLHAYPDVSKQLDANTRSHAFDGYDVDWEERTTAVSCLHLLSHAELEGELQVTGLSWNSTGSVIAAAYGRFDHEDWCTHKSSLCTWNIDRRSMNSSKADVTIDLSSCLMCLSFHPKLPAVIAGGNFNGEVLVWDTGREDETLVASSGLGDDSHREPVSKVMWIADPSSKGTKYQILSTSGDGRMLFWHLVPGSHHLRLVSGFILQTESIPRSMRISKARGDTEMGVMSASFSHEDKTLFVIGSEAGGIFKCSMNSTSPPATNVSCSVPLRSPVTFAFSPHHGPVFSLDCSPYHRNLFLSCGTDMSVRLYSMLQSKPLFSLEPASGYLFKARWSPVRPLVFCVTSADGRLLIYDLKVNRINPVVSLDAAKKKNPVYSLEYNQNRRQLLATGDAEGCIRVWKLSDDLTTQAPREMDLLADIANVQAD